MNSIRRNPVLIFFSYDTTHILGLYDSHSGPVDHNLLIQGSLQFIGIGARQFTF